MKPEDYISQGDLELYSLDMLSQKEVDAVASQLANNSVRAELDEIEAGLAILSEAGSIQPPADLRAKIMAEVNTTVPQTTTSRRFPSYLMAAAISLTIISTTLAVLFWNRWQQTETTLALALQEQTLLAENTQLTRHQLSIAKEAIDLLTNPAFVTVPLQGQGITLEYTATVLWNAETKETLLHPGTLQPLPENQQYQLWSIQEGAPVDAGIFDMTGADRLLTMKNNEDPQAFAITIEPRGGSPSPTLDQMVVLGTI
ncbi:hypothetical protein BFP72_17595 [Reichenbachiella sp. 5M10]|uniref:anti-sigma factor n=1 Tax=Reichenbachiella sp. 5M10 TaxID=1889772 RepID=UPI000C14F264|nr:anti-sigma factor [Reichenbachiella sp. 5M10]PIB37089.1 hypothetical protein BFP72_17595 [Reichenbachiella sp. 5M10]